ncbi:DNA polymerase domain-containing protein [Thermomonospora umbrina]|uniref:DNA ligase D-like protein (Predicted polymerase) n=1 Tax=Thermomonospora umbrina TaxID=111806 RepID=A0A3D9SHU1_9ACTN|nr:DNA polymerase domain-containing protein [Thermomonospora umbrina]REE95257.1 DNA ligase D-like protein (predicted polymerase) [Thermomonospora umbrina]
MASPYIEIPVGDRKVKVSNPDKVYFPERGYTKRDLVEYFLAVGDGIVRALGDRPTTLERWPGGVFEGSRMATREDYARGQAGLPGEKFDAFYQKRVPKGAPSWVRTARITFPSGRTADEVCPDEPAVVAWAANLGTLTFHPWPVRSGDVDHPDELRIDLDPQPGTDFSDAVRVALGPVRDLLDELGMEGFPKTSGKAGVHVYVRIEPRWTFTEVRRAALAFAREIERRVPAEVTSRWWKEERGEQVFLDYNQNARDRTIASAYSVRPLPHAPVSAPVTWSELADVQPEDFTIGTMPARFAEIGDPHAAIDDRSFSLEPLLELADRDEREHGLGDAPYPPNYPKMPGEPKRVQPSKARDD